MLFKELARVPLCCVFPDSHSSVQKEEICEHELSSEKMITCSSYTVPAKAAELQSHIAEHLPPESLHTINHVSSIDYALSYFLPPTFLIQFVFHSIGLYSNITDQFCHIHRGKCKSPTRCMNP